MPIGITRIEGDDRHDDVDQARAPLKIGGKASTSVPAAVSDGDRVNAYFDEFGRQHVAIDTTLSASITGPVDTELTTADLNTGAGTDTRAVVGLVLAEAGGGTLVGSANPMPVSLPATAATAANQATEIASLASIDAGIPAALGQTTMAASMPVTLASNQSTIPVSVASLPLPSGAATESSLEFGNVFFGTTIRYAALVQASTTDTWTFRSVNSSGTIVAVIVITYTDSTKATISNVARTT